MDCFAGCEVAEEGDAEISVGSTSETAEEVVAAGGDEMPVEEVAGGVEDGLHMAFSEAAALDEGIEGLKGVGGIEFEGSGEEEAFHRTVTGL